MTFRQQLSQKKFIIADFGPFSAIFSNAVLKQVLTFTTPNQQI
jgi:hypothetical protein